ncbi:hypothetical protein [Alteromonas sp. C1M14]|uniref:hypothetical protein n=1 Tax=Alteromonas sp. C1M14 TaxID=2841567 RepID=UPI001C09DF60|nr:hypothetical protein [Alteromonas sp. C1M14]MBU2979910.1 hypothetical protein [Alteromonas sp. C1M14]
MLFLFMAFILALSGTVFVYLTNRQQRILVRPLPHLYRFVGYAQLGISLVCFLLTLSVASAFFTWLSALMITLVAVPFVSLVKAGNPT